MITLMVLAALQSPAVVIANTSVIDVENGQVRAGQSILLHQGRILEVGSTVRSMPGAIRVDGSGKFVIPGLWDMHVHAAWPGLDNLFLPLLVANGVTGVREMFSTTSGIDSIRNRVTRGDLLGPRIYGAGNLVDGRPPIWPGSAVAGSAEDGRRIVDSLLQQGADFIKVYSRLSPEAYRAIAAEAKRRGVPFAGHIPSLVSAAEASDLGQRTVEHLTTLPQACARNGDSLRAELAAVVNTPGKGWDSAGRLQSRQAALLLAGYDPALCRDLARRFVKNETWMVPTIVVLRSVSHLNDTSLARDPRLAWIPTRMSNGWDPSRDFRFRMLRPEDWVVRRRVYDRQREIIALLKQEGVRFLAGTDLANPYIYPGFSLHDELGLMVENGFTPLAALQAATIEPARFLGLTDSLGTVAAGQVADLVLLEANPLEEIRNTTRIAAVVLRGQILDRKRLDQVLQAGRVR